MNSLLETLEDWNDYLQNMGTRPRDDERPRYRPGLPRAKTSPFVFPVEGDDKRHYIGTPKVWERVRFAAGLPDVRLHDLRQLRRILL